LHGGDVKKRTFVITVIAVVATAWSVFIGARAIVGTTATLRDGGSSAQASEGGGAGLGNEITALIADMSERELPDWSVGRKRDPMVPYRAPVVRTTSPTPREPSRPSYTVKAVFLDRDPTAVILAGGESVIVRVGDSVNGNRVIAIEADGVTIESGAGAHKYLLSPSN
jgi:hypothetical protein